MVERATGARLIDQAGRAHIDLCMGFGALLLGHGAAAIREAIGAQLDDGWLFGFRHGARDELAALIAAAGRNNDRVLLCDTGSDATLLALRAARAVTGRQRVAMFSGARHGLYDAALMVRRPPKDPPANDVLPLANAHLGAGIPDAANAAVAVLTFGDEGAFEIIRRHRRDLAAVIVEPCPDTALSTAHGPWLRKLQATCRDADVVFILDEIATGFRLRFGGAQELFGLVPDLTTYAGALGGGLPLAAVAGRRDIMGVFAGEPEDKTVFSGSAHAGHPLGVAAGVALLRVLSDHRDTVYSQLNGATAALTVSVNAEAQALELPVRMRAAGSMFRVDFTQVETRAPGVKPAPAIEAERIFYARLRERGIVVHASQRCFLSTAHTVGDLAEVTAAMMDGLRAVAAARQTSRLTRGV